MVGAKPLPEQMLTISRPDPDFHAIQNKKYQIWLLKEMHLQILSAKCQLFCSGFAVIKQFFTKRLDMWDDEKDTLIYELLRLFEIDHVNCTDAKLYI